MQMYAITIRLDEQDMKYFDFLKSKYNSKRDTQVMRLALKLAYDYTHGIPLTEGKDSLTGPEYIKSISKIPAMS